MRFRRRKPGAATPPNRTRYDGMIHAFFRRTELFDKAKVAMLEAADALRRAFATNRRGEMRNELPQF